jgi:uncharacterized cupin superfamily protein
MHAIHVNATTVALEDWGIRSGADRGEPGIAGHRLQERTPDAPEAGVWTSAEGGWPVHDRPDTEVAVILAGRARITNEDGSAVEVSEGDVLVLPRGWSGRWDVIEPVRKAYVVG